MSSRARWSGSGPLRDATEPRSCMDSIPDRASRPFRLQTRRTHPRLLPSSGPPRPTGSSTTTFFGAGAVAVAEGNRIPASTSGTRTNTLLATWCGDRPIAPGGAGRRRSGGMHERQLVLAPYLRTKAMSPGNRSDHGCRSIVRMAAIDQASADVTLGTTTATRHRRSSHGSGPNNAAGGSRVAIQRSLLGPVRAPFADRPFSSG